MDAPLFIRDHKGRFPVVAHLVMVAFSVAGCGGTNSSSAPTSPSAVAAPTPAPPPAPTVTTIHGTITATVTGETVGAFTSETTTFPARVTVSMPGFLTRETFVSSGTPTVDLIRDESPFSLDFYRQFVRNSLENPGTLEPLRRQEQPPRIYLRTVDEAGVAISESLIDAALNALAGNTVSQWTGGRFGTSGIERGTETREGQVGWLTFKWNPSTGDNVCGRAQIGGTWLELNYLNSRCACGGQGFSISTIRHEIGHAMGFWHTDSENDVMYRFLPPDCNQHPSVREQFHAAIAYMRSVGNRDPDVDSGVVRLRSLHVVVD